MGSSQFQVVALSFLNEDELIVQCLRFYFEALGVELFLICIVVNGGNDLFRVEFLYIDHIIRFITVSQLIVSELIAAVLQYYKDLVFSFEAADVYASFFGVEPSYFVVIPDLLTSQGAGARFLEFHAADGVLGHLVTLRVTPFNGDRLKVHIELLITRRTVRA